MLNFGIGKDDPLLNERYDSEKRELFENIKVYLIRRNLRTFSSFC